MIEKLIEERMVELAIKAWHGDYEEIIKLAEASGVPVEFHGKTLRFGGRGKYPNYSNVPSAIYPGLDPITILVCLGFAFFGMYWPWVMPDAMKALNKRWREEMKKIKKKGKAEKQMKLNNYSESSENNKSKNHRISQIITSDSRITAP